MNIDREKLISYIKQISAPKVLVVGDLALDEMIYGDAERISREAPVLILQHTKTKLILTAKLVLSGLPVMIIIQNYYLILLMRLILIVQRLFRIKPVKQL